MRIKPIVYVVLIASSWFWIGVNYESILNDAYSLGVYISGLSSTTLLLVWSAIVSPSILILVPLWIVGSIRGEAAFWGGVYVFMSLIASTLLTLVSIFF